MPYMIVYEPKVGYFVENKKTHKRYSKHALDYDTALRQIKSLYHAMKREPQGGDLIPNFFKGIANRVTGFFTGRGNNYPPDVRNFLAKNGDCVIKSISVYRKPIQSFINKTFNVLSLGTWDQALKKYGYDKLFHLYMRVDYIQPNGQVNACVIEKNEVINISNWTSSLDGGEHIDITLPSEPITINKLLENTKALMGDDKFFDYDGLGNNNCQNFVLSILTANNMTQINPNAKNFVYQDMSNVVKDMKGAPTSKISKGITDLARRFNILWKGKGLKPHHRKHLMMRLVKGGIFDSSAYSQVDAGYNPTLGGDHFRGGTHDYNQPYIQFITQTPWFHIFGNYKTLVQKEFDNTPKPDYIQHMEDLEDQQHHLILTINRTLHPERIHEIYDMNPEINALETQYYNSKYYKLMMILKYGGIPKQNPDFCKQWIAGADQAQRDTNSKGSYWMFHELDLQSLPTDTPTELGYYWEICYCRSWQTGEHDHSTLDDIMHYATMGANIGKDLAELFV